MPDRRDDGPDQLDQLVAAVRASARYHAISESLARRIGARELAKQRSMKEAVKATRNKLHQVAGAYIEEPRYAAWLAELHAAWEGDDASARRTTLRRIMARHASTRERLPILDQFYAQTLAMLGPIRSVLDLACGLNPLALDWLPLAADATYDACDIYDDMMAFLNAYFALEQTHGRPGLRGAAETRDVLASPPTQRVHLALLLKAIPCLEQIEKTAGERLLRAIQADHLLVSFPTHSLGGRQKGMAQSYETRFHELLDATGVGAGAQVTRFSFATELAFLVSR